MQEPLKTKKLFFIATTLVLSQVLILFPINSWTQNQFNIDTPFVEGLPLLLTLLLGVLLLSVLLAWIMPKFIREKTLTLLVLISVLIFFQQNILVDDYGVLDGQKIEFNGAGWINWIELVLWGLCLLSWFFFGRFIVKHASLILTFSGLASVAVTLSAVVTYDFNGNNRALTISENQKFEFSKDKNVLVFLLDAFQTDLFMQFIDAEPEIKDELSGFTFYPETTAVFSKTYPTIPLLLTGKLYQKKQGINEFLIKAYQSSLLTDLVDAGWHVGLYPNIEKLIPVNNNIMSNVTDEHGWPEKILNYMQTLDLSLLRSVPHLIKPKVYNQGQMLIEHPVSQLIKQHKWFDNTSSSFTKMPKVNSHRGLNFLANLKQFGNTSQDQPTFMFYHLMMPHSPFLLDRDLVQVKNSQGFKAYHDYAYASLKLMIKYLHELKSLGIYEQSAIMIVADHGGGEYTNLKYDTNTQTFVPVADHGHKKASAKSLLLIKGFEHSSDFKTSQSPVSLVDVMPTLADFTDLPSVSAGKPVHEVAENLKRDRFYYHYNFTGFDSKYLQDFDVFKISGPVDEDPSWEHQGVLTYAEDNEKNEEALYHLNQTIRYGTDIKQDADHSNQFIISKNPKYNVSGLQINQNKTQFLIQMAEPLIEGETYQLKLNLSSNNSNNSIKVDIGHFLSTEHKFQAPSFTHEIPFVFQGPGNNQLKIQMYDLNNQSYSDIELSKVIVKKIDVYPLPATEHGRGLDFSGNIDGFHPSGLRAAEKWGGRWTSKKEASVLFKGTDDFCLNKTIQLNLLKFQQGVDPESFTVLMNDQPLLLLDKKSSEYATTLTYDCPSHLNQANSIIKLTMTTNTTVAPTEVSVSKDVRKLGVGIKSFLIYNTKLK